MDSNITPELKNEGYIRDIVRHIQESRKEADYKVAKKVSKVYQIESGMDKGNWAYVDRAVKKLAILVIIFF